MEDNNNIDNNMTSPSGRPQMFLFVVKESDDEEEEEEEEENNSSPVKRPSSLSSRKQPVSDDDDDIEEDVKVQKNLVKPSKKVCLGAEADDTPHTVEMEGVTFDGKKVKVPLVVLKPSVLPSVCLGGFEVTPPVVFRLQSGSGPVHISGQHFVIVKESDDEEEEEEEEENNSSPVKRPSSLSSRKQPVSDDDDDIEEDVKVQKNLVKPSKKPSTSPAKASTAGALKPLALAEIKSKLAAAVKEGKPMPKTEQKFENFAKSSFKLSDAKIFYRCG
ncbi:hypothetical protein CRUP_016355 [Coryphaenoides rupestris]|nr:hypothetical protein CRUP_016355 [Coryphaenoides rupestris]